jgi:hypothetical protein
MLTTETLPAIDQATADGDGDAPREAAESDQEKEGELISGDVITQSDLEPDTGRHDDEPSVLPETPPAQQHDRLDEPQQTVQPVAAVEDEAAQISADQSDDDAAATEVTVDTSGQAETEPGAAPSPLPDPSSITARLRNLVVAVGQVEELSQRAREVAANDLALYSGIATSQRQFEEGLAEAQRIGQEAQAVYQRAFGREAKEVAEPAVIEAREVQQAFADLADAWRQQAETFLAEHPDVDALLAEQRQLEDESRRREAARVRADRFQQLVAAIDSALRQGQLNESRDYVNTLGREFPGETERIAPLRERLEHRVRATNDAAARRVLLQASELQGRGDFEAAVKLLEAMDVSGLSRESSEDLFGRWSAACSLLGQTGGSSCSATRRRRAAA